MSKVFYVLRIMFSCLCSIRKVKVLPASPLYGLSSVLICRFGSLKKWKRMLTDGRDGSGALFIQLTYF